MSGSRLARKARFLRWAMNFYPPYIGAGVRVRHISADMRLVQVKMVLRWYNRNYVGTQFGGSLYSMVDPFFVLMLMEIKQEDCDGVAQRIRHRFHRFPRMGRVQLDFKCISAADMDIMMEDSSAGKW